MVQARQILEYVNTIQLRNIKFYKPSSKCMHNLQILQLELEQKQLYTTDQSKMRKDCTVRPQRAIHQLLTKRPVQPLPNPLLPANELDAARTEVDIRRS